MAEFKEDLKTGLSWEAKFYEEISKKYPEKQIKHLNRKFEADFSIDGNKVELKSDDREFPNFFMERFSNYQTRRDGGPWQAQKYNATKFIYWFVSPKNKYQWSCYCFDVNKLVEWLDKNIYSYNFKFVKNKNYDTFGCPVPVKDLEEFPWCRKQTIVSNI
jgi:hypothetical protein